MAPRSGSPGFEWGLKLVFHVTFHRLWKSLIGVMPQAFVNRKLRWLYQPLVPPETRPRETRRAKDLRIMGNSSSWGLTAPPA